MIDMYKVYGRGDNAATSCQNGFNITPSNTVNFTHASKFIYVGTAAATLAIVCLEEASPGVERVLNFTNVAAGTILPIRAKRINVTGTSAGLNLVALY
jgi:hypothetical protein